MQNDRFTQDDYQDRGTDAPIVSVLHEEIQTSAEDLCGESVGVKKRRANISFFGRNQAPNNATVVAAQPRLNRSNSLIFNQFMPPGLNLAENKKKHEKIKNLFKMMKEVRKD